jgi:hypothetical protein
VSKLPEARQRDCSGFLASGDAPALDKSPNSLSRV